MASSVVTARFTTVMPSAAMMPANRPETCSPGSMTETSSTTAPLRATTPRPSVSTVSGSASHTTSGHSNALMSPISAAAPNAAGTLYTWMSVNSALRASSVAADSSHTSRILATGRTRRFVTTVIDVRVGYAARISSATVMAKRGPPSDDLTTEVVTATGT